MENLGVFTDTRSLRFERRLPGAANEIWRYLTEPERTAPWRARSEFEPRVGGAVVVHFEEIDPAHSPLRGVVTAWEPDRRLAYAWPEQDAKVDKDEVRFELTPEGDETRLVLTHALSPFASWMASGWHASLDALALAVAGAELAEAQAARSPSPELSETYAELHRQARAKRPGAYLKDLFQATPFHAHLGLEMTEISTDKVSVRVRKTGDLTLVGGTLHGGVLAAMVDSLGAFHAGMAAQRRLNEAGDKSDNRPFGLRTLALNVDYLRPLRGDVFTATTTTLHVGSNVIRLRGEVTDGDGAMVAAASLSFAY